MKRIFVTGVCLGVSLCASAPAYADPPRANDHNCAGVVVSSMAGPGFGSAVSALAHRQLVDDLGLANCGGTARPH
jgi:hypothetical protein